MTANFLNSLTPLNLTLKTSFLPFLATFLHFQKLKIGFTFLGFSTLEIVFKRYLTKFKTIQENSVYISIYRCGKGKLFGLIKEPARIQRTLTVLSL